MMMMTRTTSTTRTTTMMMMTIWEDMYKDIRENDVLISIKWCLLPLPCMHITRTINKIYHTYFYHHFLSPHMKIPLCLTSHDTMWIHTIRRYSPFAILLTAGLYDVCVYLLFFIHAKSLHILFHVELVPESFMFLFIFMK